MMTENEDSLLQQAKAALRRGDRMRARRLAQQLISEDPDNVEGWLILGGLSSPKASYAYLSHAYEIAPEDERVRQALRWAGERIGQETQRLDSGRTRKIQLAQPRQALQIPIPVAFGKTKWVWVAVFVVQFF